MLDILKKAEELYKECVRYKNELMQQASFLNSQKEKQDEMQADLDKRVIDVGVRETAIKKLEVQGELYQANIKLKDEIAASNSALNQEKSAWSITFTQQDKELKERKASLDSGEKQLVVDRAKLEEEKKNYKSKVLAELGKLGG